MKKNILLLAVCLSMVGCNSNKNTQASNNAQIIEYFKAQVPPQIKVEITKDEKVESLPDFKLVTIKLSDGSRGQEIKMFSNGSQLFPDIIDLKSKKSMLKDMQKKEQTKALKSIYSKENQENIISLGNDPKKETMVVFTDPECPYCRKELAGVENRLKEVNLKLILTPVHGKSSLEKSYLIYENAKKAKSDKEKIAIMKKYYAKDVDISKEKVDAKMVSKMESLRQKYLKSAIKGVPFLINEKEIK